MGDQNAGTDLRQYRVNEVAGRYDKTKLETRQLRRSLILVIFPLASIKKKTKGLV